MAIQNINVGTFSNDGTGDTLRAAGLKVNSNFAYHGSLFTDLASVDRHIVRGLGATYDIGSSTLPF